MSTISAAAPLSTTSSLSRTQAIPWLVWANVIASVSIVSGLYWDISWHEAIGRDTFWTPTHLLIQFGAVLAALGSAWVIMHTTFGGDTEARRNSVNVLGFRGPLGAFLAAWGGGAMLTSAPFDNWWHNAYGLDVKILSPPHVLLIIGIISVEFGTLLMILSRLHGAGDALQKKLSWLYLYVGSAILILLMTMIYEYTSRVLMHSAIFYRSVCLAAITALVAIPRASRIRWAHAIL